MLNVQKVVIAVSVILFSVSPGFTADPYLMLESKTNAVDQALATEGQNIAAADKISAALADMPDNVLVTEAGKQTLPEKPTASIAAEASYQPNVKTFNLPLAYGRPVSLLRGEREYLNFTVDIPYTERELGAAKDRGLGDVKLKTSYLIKTSGMLLKPSLMIKFPTGEVKDADVALGTGSTDVGFNVKSRYYLDQFRLDATLGYILNGDYSEAGQKIEYGDEYLIELGGEYSFTGAFYAGCRFTYNSHAEDTYTFGGTTTDVHGLNTFDVTPSITYRVKRYNLGITFKVLIPVEDSWNGSGPDPDSPERDITFKIKLAKPF